VRLASTFGRFHLTRMVCSRELEGKGEMAYEANFPPHQLVSLLTETRGQRAVRRSSWAAAATCSGERPYFSINASFEPDSP
jgi:hypothetical protein